MVRLSIIVPVYNVEKQLRKCVDSILAQTFTDFELILVDDGSPDNSGNICDNYALVDNRVKVIHKENGGLSDARNAGLDIASGEYIGFVDSDDYISPYMYEEMYNAICFDGTDMSICDLLRVYPDKKPDDINSKNKCSCQVMAADEFLIKNPYHVTAVSRLYKKELWNGIRFPKGKIHEDEFVVHKILERCKYVSYLNKPLYYYVVNPNSITGSYSVKRLDVVDAIIDRFNYYYKKDNIIAAESVASYLIWALNIAYKFLNLKDKVNRQAFINSKQKANDSVFEIILKEKISLKSRLYFKLFIINQNLYINAMKTFGFLNSVVKFLKHIFKAIRIRTGYIFRLFSTKKELSQIHKNKEKAIVFISTPTHGNLGDQAIVNAQYLFFENLGKKNNIVEVTSAEYSVNAGRIQKFINEDDVIVIDGGGNIGTLWIWEEQKMHDIIKRFPNNPMFIFPQTAFYSSDEEGKNALAIAKAVYGSHKKLTVFCRDEVTYKLFQTEFMGINALYVPDIVLFTNNAQKKTVRKKILLCFRSDKERILSFKFRCELEKYLEKFGYDIGSTDTVISNNVSKNTREIFLKDKWNEFSSAKLVVTDRLHGMIFSTITGTPCIAFDNISHKVRDGYEWIKPIKYVKFCECSHTIYEELDKMLHFEDTDYDRSYLEKHFEIIKEEVSKWL